MVLVGLKCVSQSVKYGLLPWPTAEKLPFLKGKVYPKMNILSLTLLNLMSFQYFLRIWNTKMMKIFFLMKSGSFLSLHWPLQLPCWCFEKVNKDIIQLIHMNWVVQNFLKKNFFCLHIAKHWSAKQKLNWTCLIHENKPHWFLLKFKLLCDTQEWIGSHTSSEHAWASIYHNWCVSWRTFICD